MLTISSSQMAEFERRETHRFEQRLMAHLSQHFPAAVAALGDAALLPAVRHLIARAQYHGIEIERDVVVYAGVGMVLGLRFDEDPALEWVPELLADPFIVSPTLRVDLLHERATAHLQAAP